MSQEDLKTIMERKKLFIFSFSLEAMGGACLKQKRKGA